MATDDIADMTLDLNERTIIYGRDNSQKGRKNLLHQLLR
jgi:hypothetical protein